MKAAVAGPGVLTHVAAGSIAGIIAVPYGRSFFEFSTTAYILLIALLLGSGLILAVRRRTLDRSLALFTCLFLLLCTWLLTTAIWSISPRQVESDALQIGALMAVCVGMLLAGSSTLPAAVARYVVLAAIAVTAHVVSQYLAAGNLRGFDIDLKDAYLVAGSIIGAGATLALTRGIVSTRRSTRWTWYCSGVLLLIGVALSLARGALLFSLLVCLAAAGYAIIVAYRGVRIAPGYVRIRRSALFGTIAVLSVVAGTITAAFQVERTAARLERLLSGREQASERTELWSTALTNIDRAAFGGYGLGSNGIISGAGDDYYPHNILLQVWLDGGLPGFVLLLAVLAFPLICVLKRPAVSTNYGWLPFVSTYAFCLLEYMKSSDSYSGRIVVVFAMLVIISIRTPHALNSD